MSLGNDGFARRSTRPQGGDEYNAATRGLSIQQGTQNATAWVVLYPSPSGRERTCTMTTAQDHTPTTFMRSVSVSDFRCFGDEQTARLAPLTLFVGDNSTGKSSLMALIGMLWEALFSRNLIPNFNPEPFDLGGFREMVHFRGGRGRRRTSFTAGVAWSDKLDKFRSLEAMATFHEKDGYTEVQSYMYSVDGYSIKVCDASKHVTFMYREPEGPISFVYEFDLPASVLAVNLNPLNDSLWQLIQYEVENNAECQKRDRETIRAMPNKIYTASRRISESDFRIAFMAPLRAQPKRIYQVGRSIIDPVAHNLPNYLMTIKYTDPSHWRQLKASIETFGKHLGLFSQFDVVAMANGKGTGPFEMRVRGNPNQPRLVGPWRNLVDVGYGVSQILPLVCRLSDPGVRLHLIQQPEIHLHPKAQAALGSFLCQWAARGRGQVIVETHSQYLLDRVRMEVRDSRIDIGTTDVSVAFFELQGLESRIANIGFDHSGNVSSAPPGYNSFFVDEVTRSMGL